MHHNKVVEVDNLIKCNYFGITSQQTNAIAQDKDKMLLNNTKIRRKVIAITKL